MNFAERTEQHRRLSILRLLAEAPGFTINDSIIAGAIDGLGIASSRDQIRTSLGWLAEQGLLTQASASGLTIASLTQRGADVAAGRAKVDGVQPPSPGG